MVFQFEVPDEVVSSVEEFIAHQVTVFPDPDTGLPAHRKLFVDVHDYFEKALLGACQQPCTQFPSPALRAQLVAKRQAEAAFMGSIQAKALRGNQ